MKEIVFISTLQVALTTFATYILSSSENILAVKKAFVSLALFNVLRFPIYMIPTLLSNAVQVSPSNSTCFVLKIMFKLWRSLVSWHHRPPEISER